MRIAVSSTCRRRHRLGAIAVRDERDAIAARVFDAARQIQLQEGHTHVANRRIRRPDEVIHGYRRRAEKLQHAFVHRSTSRALREPPRAGFFKLPADEGPFDGAYAGFWWSHLRHAECGSFLDSLKRCLAPGAVVVLMDNLFVRGSSTPLSRTDEEGNTWQQRKLPDGGSYEVLKNFPTEDQLREQVKGFGVNCRHTALEYYWLFAFESA